MALYTPIEEAWGRIAGGTGAILSGHGLISSVRIGPGEYNLTIDRPIRDDQFQWFVIPVNAQLTGTLSILVTETDNLKPVTVYNSLPNPTDSDFYFWFRRIGFGEVPSQTFP